VDLSELYELLARCTVRLTVESLGAQGTGFFVAPGLILTCAHVVKGAYPDQPVKVVGQEGELPESFIKADSYLPEFYPDLAILRIALDAHPCVYLQDGYRPGDKLFVYGYPEDEPGGDTVSPECEGWTRIEGLPPEERFLKFKDGQVIPGLSGGAVLNERTGGVCGIVKQTRDRYTSLGGRAVPTSTILARFRFLAGQQLRYHLGNRAWLAHPAARIASLLFEDGAWVSFGPAEFWMGAQRTRPAERNYHPDAGPDEAPVRKVHLDGFSIRRFPVTVAEYQPFVDTGGYADERHWKAGGFGDYAQPEAFERQKAHPDYPVVRVSWYEAAAFADWAGCRLPTEAEWEMAARWPEGRVYPWGDEKPDETRMNCSEAVGHPTPAGKYPNGRTPQGVEDMAGNVWEWCQDWYGTYPSWPARNPGGPDRGRFRVIRGGAWAYPANEGRASKRQSLTPGLRTDSLGFRLVRER
jgi:formylglycine-generating enzyme required for sulfatase activity